jgi:hypothetical protein
VVKSLGNKFDGLVSNLGAIFNFDPFEARRFFEKSKTFYAFKGNVI